MSKQIKILAYVIGAAVCGAFSATGAATASENPFSQADSHPMQIAAQDGGKCGKAMDTTEAKHGKTEGMQGGAGGKEGKCGGAKGSADGEHALHANGKKNVKCGSAKCGATKKP